MKYSLTCKKFSFSRFLEKFILDFLKCFHNLLKIFWGSTPFFFQKFHKISLQISSKSHKILFKILPTFSIFLKNLIKIFSHFSSFSKIFLNSSFFRWCPSAPYNLRIHILRTSTKIVHFGKCFVKPTRLKNSSTLKWATTTKNWTSSDLNFSHR